MRTLAKKGSTARHPLRWLGSLMIGGLAVGAAFGLMPAQKSCAQPRQQISYSQDLLPIFRGYCMTCHQPGGEGFKASGFDPSTYEGLMKGTKFGPMVVPGQPDISNLVVLIQGRAAPEMRMPHNGRPLPSCLRDEIWTWIFQGAKNN